MSTGKTFQRNELFLAHWAWERKELERAAAVRLRAITGAERFEPAGGRAGSKRTAREREKKKGEKLGSLLLTLHSRPPKFSEE